ncbi:MAG: heme-binding protein, partial [Flavobacteriia bacterium]|nr:heme-binding protein [Flavobacteriia bacterium]
MYKSFSLSSLIKSLVVLTALLTGSQSMAYEEPSYRIVHQGDGFEIRKYEDRLAAQVISSGGQNGSFGLLFQYISGANTGSAKVSMTVPVAQSEKIEMTVPVAQSSDD